MATTGDVQISISDGASGVVVVPASSVQVVIGPTTTGIKGSILATRSPTTLRSVLGYGSTVEYAAAACLAGGTVLVMDSSNGGSFTGTPGTLRGSHVGRNHDADAAKVTFPGLPGFTPSTVAPGTSVATVTLDATRGAFDDYYAIVAFTKAGLVDGTAATGALYQVSLDGGRTFGVQTRLASTLVATEDTTPGNKLSSWSVAGASPANTNVGVLYWSSDLDSSKARVRLYSDSGRTTLVATGELTNDLGGTITLTASGGSGLTGSVVTAASIGSHTGTLTVTTPIDLLAICGFKVNMGVGTILLGDFVNFNTIGMTATAADVSNALTALQASPYAATGWGSMHILGAWTASDAATIGADSTGELDSMATNYVFTRAMLSTRDASPAVAYGGTAESDSTWTSSVMAEWSALSSKRLCICAGYYNTTSAYQSATAGKPKYRRSLSWAQAIRQIEIPPQRHSGRVRDGSLGNIVQDPVNNPIDYFVYHDERTAGLVLDQQRFCTARTRIGLPGIYVANPNLMSPPGSDFTILPLGNVMDIACSIVHQTGQQEINSDVRLYANGTIYENDALSIEQAIKQAIDINMTAQAEISACAVSVDRTTNVQTSKKVVITVSITARGYILEEDITIGFSSPS